MRNDQNRLTSFHLWLDDFREDHNKPNWFTMPDLSEVPGVLILVTVIGYVLALYIGLSK